MTQYARSNGHVRTLQFSTASRGFGKQLSLFYTRGAYTRVSLLLGTSLLPAFPAGTLRLLQAHNKKVLNLILNKTLTKKRAGKKAAIPITPPLPICPIQRDPLLYAPGRGRFHLPPNQEEERERGFGIQGAKMCILWKGII